MESLVQGSSTNAPSSVRKSKMAPCNGSPKAKARWSSYLTGNEVCGPSTEERSLCQSHLIISQRTCSNERAGDGGCSHIDEVIFVALLMQGSGGGVGSRVEHTGYSFVHKDNQISPEGRDPRSIYYGWS